MRFDGEGDEEQVPRPGAVMRVSSIESDFRRAFEIIAACHGSLCFNMLLVLVVGYLSMIYLRVVCVRVDLVILMDITELLRPILSLCEIMLVNLFLMYVVAL